MASGIIVDHVVPAADLPRLAIVCLFLVVIIAASSIFQAIQGLLVMRIEGRVSATLIPAFWDRLLRLPSRFFARFSAGDLASRAMGLRDSSRRSPGRSSPRSLPGFFSFFNLGLLYYYSWKLALCTTGLLAVLFCRDRSASGRLLRARASIRRSMERFPDFSSSSGRNRSRCEPRGREPAFSRVGETVHRTDAHWRSGRDGFSSGIHHWLAVFPILTAMVVYFGAVHFDPSSDGYGQLHRLHIAFANLMAAVLAVGYTSIGLLELLPMVERLRPILEEQPEFPAASSSRSAHGRARSRIMFRFAIRPRRKERRFSTMSAFKSARASSWRSWAPRARENRP